MTEYVHQTYATSFAIVECWCNHGCLDCAGELVRYLYPLPDDELVATYARHLALSLRTI